VWQHLCPLNLAKSSKFIKSLGRKQLSTIFTQIKIIDTGCKRLLCKWDYPLNNSPRNFLDQYNLLAPTPTLPPHFGPWGLLASPHQDEGICTCLQRYTDREGNNGRLLTLLLRQGPGPAMDPGMGSGWRPAYEAVRGPRASRGLACSWPARGKAG